MRKLYIVALALAVALLGVAPVFAASHANLKSVPRPFVAPAATTPGIITTTITIGTQDIGVLPCFNCVDAPPPDGVGLGLAYPLSVVTAGSPYTVVLTADDVAYSGFATFTYDIRATATSKPIQTGHVSGDVYPSIWYAYFPIDAPTTPGRYMLQGSIIQGSATSIINASLIIQ